MHSSTRTLALVLAAATLAALDSSPAAMPTRRSTAVFAGLAPGRVIPGTEVVVYGTALRGARVVLGAAQHPQGEASVLPPGPAVLATTTATIPLTVNDDGTAGRFVVPPVTRPGTYPLRLLAAGGYREPAAWLVVEPAVRTIPLSAEARPFVSLPLVSGQTIRRTLDGRAAQGWFTDVHFFHFVAGKGAQIEAEVSRVDRTLSPLHPDSIELELYIVHPEGWVPLPFQGHDTGRNSERELQVRGAFLPKGGLWRVVVGTSHGRGEYALRFTLVGLAPLTDEERFIPVAGNLMTVRAGDSVRLAALQCDPRGVPLSGALGILDPSGGQGTRVSGPRTEGYTDPDGVLAITMRVAGQSMQLVDLRLVHQYPSPESLPGVAARTPTPTRPVGGLAAWIVTQVTGYLGEGVQRLGPPHLDRQRRL